MRLLSTRIVQIIEVYGNDVPSYAILSHTWSDGEILLQDLQNSKIHGKPWSALNTHPSDILGDHKRIGLEKLRKSVELAHRNQYDYIWVDTCCIDKTSSAELSEAINSMYRWYAEADVCYAYLSDVPASSVEYPFKINSKFRLSRWFRRGWTLQELIASQHVEIFSRDWSYLGAKTEDLFTKLLNAITGIEIDVLLGEISPQDMSIAARMHWAAERQTTRVEDIAYCLLGIFDVNMPLLYGEGKRSFIRLQEAILSKEEDQSIFAWYSYSVDTPLSAQFSGLLADSPDKFRDGKEIEMTMPLTLTGEPYAVTSKGLGVDFLLLSCDGDVVGSVADFRVILNCERLQHGKRESPVIYLKRIWGMGNQFARVVPDQKTFITPDSSLFETGLYERVFVKQDPSSDMRTIRILAASDSSQLILPRSNDKSFITATNWKIKDAWPKEGWNERTQTLQTRELTFGVPCGVLRLEINDSSKPTTIDVAIGMHAPSDRVSRSWCKVMNLNSFLDPESAFMWAIREAKAGNIDYHSLSTRDIHGVDVPNCVVVTEQNRKRTLDIRLHVLVVDEPFEEDTLDSPSRGEECQLIPLSTLSEAEGREKTVFLGQHPFLHAPTRMAKNWDAWQSEVAMLMGDICIVDSMDISVFPKRPFGSMVRTKERGSGTTALGSLEEYCLTALRESDQDNEARRLVHILCGKSNADGNNVDAARDAIRYMEGRPKLFLQFHPIHWAVVGGQVDFLRALLKLHTKADAMGGPDRSLSALHLAFLLPNPDIITCLLEHIEETRPFGVSVTFWDQTSPNIDTEDYPLHFAAAYATSPGFWGTPPSIIDYSLKNAVGETPLHRAAAMGNLLAVRNILQPVPYRNISQSSAVDDRGRTALWHAACTDHTGAITHRLLNDRIHPDLADLDGIAPIHVACRQGTFGCLQELKASAANLDLPVGSLGFRPAHFAAIFGRIVCLQFLLDSGARAHSYRGEGTPSLSALHMAIANGHEECARAIWNWADPKPLFKGWSLCIVLEPEGPTLKWMHLEVNEEYWFAIEDPWEEAGTRDFSCFSDEGSIPKLWVRPSVQKSKPDEETRISVEEPWISVEELRISDDVVVDEMKEEAGKIATSIASAPGPVNTPPRPESPINSFSRTRSTSGHAPPRRSWSLDIQETSSKISNSSKKERSAKVGLTLRNLFKKS